MGSRASVWRLQVYPWRQTTYPPEIRRGSRSPGSLRCTMELHTIVLCVILLNIHLVSAKGGHGGHGGGGRGRGGRRAGSHSSTSTHSHYVSASHSHYSYHPPSHIAFTCRFCSSPGSYPVYHGQPPTYIYKYREYNSRFGDLLTGLALYNLGRSTTEHEHRYYRPRPNEKCSLQVRDKNHFEETEFPCMMMSSFVNHAAEMGTVRESAPVDITSLRTDISLPKDTSGTPIEITREQECLLWHNTTITQEKKEIPCALLKVYAGTMTRPGVPVYVWFPTVIGIVIVLTLCCQCWRRKKEMVEEEPLNQTVIGYYSNVQAPLNQPVIAYCSNRIE